MEAAFCTADLVTLTGSMIPCAIRSPYSLVAKIATLPAGHGFNAATGEYGDLMAQGIIDPVKVTRSAVQNAASIAGMLLTTETLVVEKPEEKEPAGDGHGHGHSHPH